MGMRRSLNSVSLSFRKLFGSSYLETSGQPVTFYWTPPTVPRTTFITFRAGPLLKFDRGPWTGLEWTGFYFETESLTEQKIKIRKVGLGNISKKVWVLQWIMRSKVRLTKNRWLKKWRKRSRNAQCSQRTNKISPRLIFRGPVLGLTGPSLRKTVHRSDF